MLRKFAKCDVDEPGAHRNVVISIMFAMRPLSEALVAWATRWAGQGVWHTCVNLAPARSKSLPPASASPSLFHGGCPSLLFLTRLAARSEK